MKVDRWILPLFRREASIILNEHQCLQKPCQILESCFTGAVMLKYAIRRRGSDVPVLIDLVAIASGPGPWLILHR